MQLNCWQCRLHPGSCQQLRLPSPLLSQLTRAAAHSRRMTGSLYASSRMDQKLLGGTCLYVFGPYTVRWLSTESRPVPSWLRPCLRSVFRTLAMPDTPPHLPFRFWESLFCGQRQAVARQSQGRPRARNAQQPQQAHEHAQNHSMQASVGCSHADICADHSPHSKRGAPR
jgi:hypothetical protein